MFERQRKVTIPTSISRDIWSLRTRDRVENVHCVFINTVSCDEQHGLYRIVLTYVSDDLEAFL